MDDMACAFFLNSRCLVAAGKWSNCFSYPTWSVYESGTRNAILLQTMRPSCVSLSKTGSSTPWSIVEGVETLLTEHWNWPTELHKLG